MTPTVVEIRQGVLSKNAELAFGLRERFEAAGVTALNFVSSPGTGKTALLEQTLRRLREAGARCAALVGDLETDNDARRLAASGAPVRQINTHRCCHLEAAMIGDHLGDWNLDELEYLFIENVGNLVCPASYDLGEKLRVALLSVTEGEDKPLKYPAMFHSADVVVVTKMDLAEACDFDREAAHANLQSVHPGVKIFEVSAKRGNGMSAWISWLLLLHTGARSPRG